MPSPRLNMATGSSGLCIPSPGSIRPGCACPFRRRCEVRCSSSSHPWDPPWPSRVTILATGGVALTAGGITPDTGRNPSGTDLRLYFRFHQKYWCSGTPFSCNRRLMGTPFSRLSAWISSICSRVIISLCDFPQSYIPLMQTDSRTLSYAYIRTTF